MVVYQKYLQNKNDTGNLKMKGWKKKKNHNALIGTCEEGKKAGVHSNVADKTDSGKTARDGEKSY